MTRPVTLVASGASELRLGLVGFGKLAREAYVPALRRIEGAVVAAVADPLAASRQAARGVLPGAALYSSVEELLERDMVDAVLAASPPSTHLAVFENVCSRGLPLFVEKPFLLPGELDQAQKMSGRELIMVDFNRRFWRRYEELARTIRSGRLGKIQALDLVFEVDAQSWSSVTPHRLDPREGGALYDLGSSMVDLILFALGEFPCRVAAEIESRRLESDRIRLRLEFASGTVATARIAYAEGYRERVVAEGERGRMGLETPYGFWRRAPAPGTLRRAAALSADGVGLVAAWVRPAARIGASTVAASLRRFVRSVRERTRFEPGFTDAERVAVVLEAALAAASARVPVAVQAPGSARAGATTD